MTDHLQNIKLPNYTIAQLYSNVLIGDKTNTVKPLQQFNSDIKSLGNCQNGIVFIVHNSEDVIINNDVLDLLIAILTKLNLSLQNVAIVNTAHQAYTYQDIIKQFNATKIIFLGVEVDKVSLPIVFPKYKVQAYAGCSYLCSAALDTLKGNDPKIIEEKKLMWNSIKGLLLS